MKTSLFFIAFFGLVLSSGPTSAKISANHKAGAVIVGPTTTDCDGSVEGGLRWSSADLTFEMCDGISWRKIIASSGVGIPSTPASDTGYFVLSAGTWLGGNVGSVTGSANTKCLNDLTDNDWMGKDDATDRGLLVAGKVKAFLCNASICNDLLPHTTYTFAVSGQADRGGAFFVSDADGLGPDNTQSWAGTNYFGGDYFYWTNRGTASSALWSASPHQTAATAVCDNWNTGLGTRTGRTGNSNNTNSGRWISNTENCIGGSTHHLICIVHP